MDEDMDLSHTDITKLNGAEIAGKFDVLCGGFPCQAFSLAAHGKNIAEKNLWDHMFRVVQESCAPIVFGENVSVEAIDKAAKDLESVGYRVEYIRLGCEDLGADHRRNRFWLLAVRNDENGTNTFAKMSEKLSKLPKLTGKCWTKSPLMTGCAVEVKEADRRKQLLGVGNAQSPFVAATAFRILANRLLRPQSAREITVNKKELSKVFAKRKTWMTREFREGKNPDRQIEGLVHTPTTMANYCYPSMLIQHAGCRNYVKVFCEGRPNTVSRPEPVEAEYLMGFPIGASSPFPLDKRNMEKWNTQIYSKS